MSDNIKNLTQENFDEEVIAADQPVLVDFWAEWCGPCKMIAPILDEIADEHGDKLTIAKVNVDEANELALRFNVMSIPTLLVFKDGDVAKRMVGASGKSKLVEDLTEIGAL
ncbi:MAG: thioredoxin [Actinomycetota bacterium]